jgi:sulfite reductase beta subunit-like hemoprotein
VPASEIADALERLVRCYLDKRHGEETFHAFCRRFTDEDLRGFLAGEVAGEQLEVAAEAMA